MVPSCQLGPGPLVWCSCFHWEECKSCLRRIDDTDVTSLIALHMTEHCWVTMFLTESL
uniref:Uncharacterized protein n=1 Tax=Anguilla anguilla TaxID=7936 RepID=A0A0E9S980_ANGAN